MRYVLALDPAGEHTGVAFFEQAETGLQLIEARTCHPMDILDRYTGHLSYFSWLIGKDDLVVIERPPATPGRQTEDSAKVIAAYWLLRWYYERIGVKVKSVAPGAWKPAGKHLVTPAGVADKHQRDAYRMALVVLGKIT